MVDSDYSGLFNRPSTPQARASSPSKRHRAAPPDPFVDADAMPRTVFDMRLPPPPFQPPLAGDQSSPSRSSTGHSSPTKPSSRSSRVSGRSSKASSPVKNLRAFVLGPTSILPQEFGDPDSQGLMPAALKEVLTRIRRFSKGIHAISATMRDDIASAHSNVTAAFDDDAVQVFDPTGLRDTYSPTPTIEVADSMFQRAVKCSKNGSDEAAWMCLVHILIIMLAIENRTWKNTVDFISCTTATISPPSLKPHSLDTGGAVSKKVDGALVFEPDDAMANAISHRLPNHGPFDSINQTNYRPLRSLPIGVNIEIKRAGEGWDEALVQHGVWISAQFARLSVLLEESRDEQRLKRLQEQLQQGQPLSLQHQPQPQQPPGEPVFGAAAAPPATCATSSAPSTATSATAGTHSGQSSFESAASSVTTQAATAGHDAGEGAASTGVIDMVPFLPLIVIQGHDWNFLAATRNEKGATQDGKGATHIWSKVLFGSTSSRLGIYQIVATLQFLAHWTHTVYRPWFARNALGMID